MAKLIIDLTSDASIALGRTMLSDLRGSGIDPFAPVEVTGTITEDVIAPTEVAETVGTEAVEVDSIGMPYDPEVHAKNKGKNSDGTWKALRGNAAAAAEAREKFKATGGNVTPPTDIPTAPTVAPTVPAAPAAPAPVAPTVPAAPAAAVEPAPSVDEVVTKLTEFLGAGITEPTLAELYTEAGVQNLGDPTTELAADENMRRVLSTLITRAMS